MKEEILAMNPGEDLNMKIAKKLNKVVPNSFKKIATKIIE